MSYGSFFCYEKSDNFNIVMKERDATIVRYIYLRYLQNVVHNTIAKRVRK